MLILKALAKYTVYNEDNEEWAQVIDWTISNLSINLLDLSFAMNIWKASGRQHFLNANAVSKLVAEKWSFLYLFILKAIFLNCKSVHLQKVLRPDTLAWQADNAVFNLYLKEIFLLDLR